MGGNNWSSTSWGSWQTASYTGTVDNTGGGAFSGSGNSVTAGANSSTSSRSGNLRLSQTRSGIQENGNSWPSPSNINVPLEQYAKAIYVNFIVTWSGNPSKPYGAHFTLISNGFVYGTQEISSSGVLPGDTETFSIQVANDYNVFSWSSSGVWYAYHDDLKQIQSSISPGSGNFSANNDVFITFNT